MTSRVHHSRKILALLLVAVATVAAQAAQAPQATASGLWVGTLVAGSSTLRLQFHLDPPSGACSIDSLDQGAEGIGCTDLKSVGGEVSFLAPSIHGSFHGTLSSDGKTLKGSWSQGADLPLTMTRQNGPAGS